MSTELIVAIIVLVAMAAAVGWYAFDRRRTDRLRTRFGSEYDRAVELTEDRRRAEADLQAREKRVEGFDIRPLSGFDRARFTERWRVVQGLFVDDPTTAVQLADGLIGDLMQTRGYPVGDFEQRAADLSVDHPQVVDHYRTAHGIAELRSTTEVDTEQLRQAFVHYRALFSELLETDETTAADLRAWKADGAADEEPIPEKVPTTERTEEPAEPARR